MVLSKKCAFAKTKRAAFPHECDSASHGCTKAFRCYDGKEMETNAFEVKGIQIYEAESAYYKAEMVLGGDDGSTLFLVYES